MHHAIFVPPFGPLANPRRLQDVAIAAEEHGWDAVFVWDHVLRENPVDIADAWIAMAAMASVTERIRLGPMVTPLIRRRPIKLAREVLSIDLLSNGRITLGLGLGVDTGGELARFGEVVDARTRGAMLEEGTAVLAELLEGGEVNHHGEHYRVDGVTLRPRCVQQPRPPMWLAATESAQRPVRRAARYEGIFPIRTTAGGFRRTLDTVEVERGDLDGFDVCLVVDGPEPPDYADEGATWLAFGSPETPEIDELFQVIEAGPPH